jgi:serine protease Do
MSEQPKKGFPGGRRMLGVVMVLGVLGLGIGIGSLITDRVDATGPGDSRLEMQEGKPVAGESVLNLSKAFEEVSNRVESAVVNINTEEVISRRGRQMPQPAPGDPMFDFFERFFGGVPQMPEQQTVRSLGSGVIVDPQGYIITNNHVVEGATKIKVNLAGGNEYSARMIGADPISDIAVIKISGSKPFPYAKVGNSKGMKVGDWVLAIGSPFGLEQTVTAGIISTTGRTFKEGDGPSDYSVFNEYLQTDAAINRGNSGGPLVNMNAEVIGINSFISTPTGSNAGIGFAVPSQLFVRVYNQVLETGKVSRGWIGVSMNSLPFTPAMAEFFKVKQGSGVLITQLIDEKGNPSTEGPAAKAGVKPEDVVIEFDGNKIRDNQDFLMAVTNTVPGRKAKMKVVRDGVEKDLEIVLAERSREAMVERRYSFEESEEPPRTEIGLEFDNVPPTIAKTLNITGGVLVTSVKQGSLADEAGLVGPTRTEEGEVVDVIVAANGRSVKDKDDLFNTVKAMRSGSPVVLKFMRVLPRSEPAPYYTSITKP